MASQGGFIVRDIGRINEFFDNDKILPVFFLCGEDDFAVESAFNEALERLKPLTDSDFDFESILLQKNYNLEEVIGIAQTFPFGGGKKVVALKEFESVDQKERLLPYIKDPSDYTVLLISHKGKVDFKKKGLFSELASRGYAFQTSKTRSDSLISWVINHAARMKVVIDHEAAGILVEMTGEDKGILEMQLKKFIDYAGETGKITREIILETGSKTKTYTVFDLTDAVGNYDKAKAFLVGNNLLENGGTMPFILTIVGKFIHITACAREGLKRRLPDTDLISKLKVAPYYFSKCKQAASRWDEARLTAASRALLEAEVNVKSSSLDDKTAFVMLIARMFSAYEDNASADFRR